MSCPLKRCDAIDHGRDLKRSDHGFERALLRLKAPTPSGQPATGRLRMFKADTHRKTVFFCYLFRIIRHRPGLPHLAAVRLAVQ